MPTTFNYSRATFVQHEYRFKTASDAALKSKYSDATDQEIDTNLTSAAAATLVTTMFTELKKVAKVFTVEIDKVMLSDDLKTTIPHYTLVDPKYGETGAITRKTCRIKVDPLRQKTTLVIRG